MGGCEWLGESGGESGGRGEWGVGMGGGVVGVGVGGAGVARLGGGRGVGGDPYKTHKLDT